MCCRNTKKENQYYQPFLFIADYGICAAAAKFYICLSTEYQLRNTLTILFFSFIMLADSTTLNDDANYDSSACRFYPFFFFKNIYVQYVRHDTMCGTKSQAKWRLFAINCPNYPFVKLWTAMRLYLVPPAIKLFVLCECAKIHIDRTANDFTARI